MLVRACKIRTGDALRVGGKFHIVSSTRPEFDSVGIFARPLGRGMKHDILVFVEREALVEIIRDRGKK